MIELYLILLFMIAAAFIAVQIKDLLSSVIAVGAAGLVLSVAFLILKAPDLAITQFVVEILCVIILIRATVRRETVSTKNARGFLTAAMSLIFIGIFLFFAYSALKELPDFGEPLMRLGNTFIQIGQEKTGAANIVGSVILDFRAYDTLGEATVLFTAVIGALVVLRRIGRKRKDQAEEEDE
jgi:multisubunit Na+/H+ antiporter MnhB subunit